MRAAGKLDAALVAEQAAELEEAEQALARIEAEHERVLAEAAADLAQGVVSPGDAASRTGPSQQKLERARTRAARLRLGVPELRRRLDVQVEEQRERERKAQAAILNRACVAANKSASALAKALAQADQAARDLVARRAAVDLAVESAGVLTRTAPPCQGERAVLDLLWGAPAESLPAGGLPESVREEAEAILAAATSASPPGNVTGQAPPVEHDDVGQAAPEGRTL